jgi:hypothetical protein
MAIGKNRPVNIIFRKKRSFITLVLQKSSCFLIVNISRKESKEPALRTPSQRYFAFFAITLCILCEKKIGIAKVTILTVLTDQIPALSILPG